MSDNTLVNDSATDATDVKSESQALATKTYSQDEVDNMMARMRGSLEKKLLKPYEDLGDPTELRTLKQQAEAKAQSDAIKRGEFEKTLQDLAAKKDAEIQKRDSIIREYKVNTPLLSAAAQFKAVNAEQVKALLINQVRLNDSGDVEVVGQDGSVRYNDRGEPIGVADLVQTFLNENPHFVSASPSTTNAKSNVSNSGPSKTDISKLDMKNPEHRKIYAEYRKTNGIA